MVITAKRLFFFKGKEATLVASGLVLAAASIAVAVAMEAGIAVAAVAVLHVLAFVGAGLAWLRADAAAKAAERASADLLHLAHRIRLDQQRAPAAATPALRSTMAEVTGTVGMLGGVVRELARNVAAQNRDVAQLKDTLNEAVRGEDDKSALRVMPALRPSRDTALSRSSPQPEPSLLPRKETEDEIRRMRLVTQAFETDQVELHLQPVVALPQRKVRFYEALARLRLVDGTLLGPAEFLPTLERLGRAPEFDRRIVIRAISVARHLLARGSEAIVGVNLSPRSIREPDFLFSLVGLMDSAPEILGKVVLELPQGAWRTLGAEQKEALALLRDKGVPLSLDRAVDLDFDARTLADLGVRFLKLPAELMIAADQAEGPTSIHDTGVRDFTSVLRREGIKLVADRVEREEMVPALINLGMPLAQGFVFAAPRAVRSEVLVSPARNTAFSQQSDGSDLRRAG
jgi:cyclic-di-GMP phosphodiesterase TipF (flagellum assembly factor)